MSQSDITGLIEFLPEELASFLREPLIRKVRNFIQKDGSSDCISI